MKNKKVIVVFLILFVMLVWVSYSFIGNKKEVVKNEITKNIPNKVTTESNIMLTESEKETLLKSVDGYMNEYRLPKGVENSYEVLIDSRLNDSIKILINPKDKYSDSKTTVYARKINNIWTVDSKSGPWCTLADFDSGECY